MQEAKTLLRSLPSVDRLLSHARAEAWLRVFNRDYVARVCREVLDDRRREIVDGGLNALDHVGDNSILARVEAALERGRAAHPVRVVNATGTLLHTNLGRARLARTAVEAVTTVAAHPSNLEYDLDKGARGRRESEIERLLIWLTGAGAATVVNNNAAAVLVAVNSLAAGKEVVISRGELVEIGGAFRIPEIIAKSGALLREVGTTNRTHAADFERAIGPNTGLLLKVHTSNYRIVGFSSDVALSELVAIGSRHTVPVMEDLGSGALVDLSTYGLPREPLVAERVAMGANVVTFSGDKLLGGPQAGLLVGDIPSIASIRDNALYRAVRCDKMTLAALDATLRLYQQSPDLARDLPTLAAFTRPMDDLATLGTQAQTLVQDALGGGFSVALEEGTCQVGSGALPTDELPTMLLVVTHRQISAASIAARFRAARPPIIGRIHDNRFLLDLRAIDDARDLIPHA